MVLSMTEGICPRCGEVRQLEELSSPMNVPNKQITFEERSYKCTVCGCEFYTPSMWDENIQRAREAQDK